MNVVKLITLIFETFVLTPFSKKNCSFANFSEFFKLSDAQKKDLNTSYSLQSNWS